MKYKLLLILFFLLGLLIRLYHLTTPLADWHSWRQADTASVSRRYSEEGIDLLRPKYQDLSSIPSGLENPLGYRMVEFPVYNYLHVQLSRLTRSFGLGIVETGRLLSIGLSLLGAGLFFLLIKRVFDYRIALFSLFFYLFLPFQIFYQRTILPENLLVLTVMATLYFYQRFLEAKGKNRYSWFVLSSLSLVIAVLVKPTAYLFILPLFVLAGQHYGLKIFRQLNLWLLLGIPLGFFCLWRWWIGHFPEGIPAYTWLLNGNHIRFRPAFFRWLFGDRIGRLILGYWGTAILCLSLFIKETKKAYWFLLSWVGGMLLYLFIFATGNVQHDYYQIVIMPVICLMLGVGLAVWWNNFGHRQPFLTGIVLTIITTFSLAFSWFHIRDYYNINHPEIVLAGQAADALLPKEAKVIAPYMGDTAFLFQTNRLGWPIGGDIAKRIEQGASYYISVNYDEETSRLRELCQVVKAQKEWVIIDLQQCQGL
jgi:hypothetical protein